MKHIPPHELASQVITAAMANSKAAIGEESHAFCVGNLQALLTELVIYHPGCRETLQDFINRSGPKSHR